MRQCKLPILEAAVSAPAFASDQGFEVKPVKQMKKSQNKFDSAEFANFNKTSQKNNGSYTFAKVDKQSRKTPSTWQSGRLSAPSATRLLTEYQNGRD